MHVDEGLRRHLVYGFKSIGTHGYLKTTLGLLEPAPPNTIPTD